MSWINPEYLKRQETKALNSIISDSKPIVRPCIRSLDVKICPKDSCYPRSQCTHGFAENVAVEKGEKLSEKMALAMFNLKCDLEDWVRENHPRATVHINSPEIFPVDKSRCIVLVTGWIPETIILQS